jgi:hypothetical protein
VSEQVYIPAEGVMGEIVSLMAYGAVVRYFAGGIEFFEMLADEDFVVLGDSDD